MKTAVMDNPQVPCYKAPEKGTCRMRVDEESAFMCTANPEECPYFVRIYDKDTKET